MAAEETGYLIQTLWDQSGKIKLPDGKELEIDYNAYCPYNLVQGKIVEKHSVTGCTNTADSQVIYYWLGKNAGKDLTFTAADTDYYSVLNFTNQEKKTDLATSRQVEAKDNENYGALSVSNVNTTLAERNLNSGEFIAALNFFCGIKNHSSYSTTETSSGGVTVNANDETSGLYADIGFVSYYAVGSSDETFFTQKSNNKISVNELALEIIRENIDYGEPVRFDSESHSMILDGYRENEETGEYEYHVNIGWGSDAKETRWYTADDLKNPKKDVYIHSFYIDLTPKLYIKITNDLDQYAAGSMERGAERINNAQKETTVSVDTSAVNEETIELSQEWLVKSKANAVFSNINTDFLFSSEYGFYSLNSTITVDKLSSALIVNNKNGAVAYGSDKQAELTLSAGSVFAGSKVLSDDVLEALDNYKDTGYEAVSDIVAKATGIAFSGGSQNDTITLKDDSVVMGDISMKGGSNNVISIETGSMWIGNLLDTNTTIKFDITSVNDDVMILSSAKADAFVNTDVSLKASIGLEKADPLTGVFSLIEVAKDDKAFQNAVLTLEYMDGSTKSEVTLSVNGDKYIVGDMEYSLIADTDNKNLLLSAGWIKTVTGKEETELKLDRYYADITVKEGTAKITEGDQSMIAQVTLSDGILNSDLDDLKIRTLEVTAGANNALKNELIQFKNVKVAFDTTLSVSGEQFEQFLEETTNAQIIGTLKVDDDADGATLQSLLKREDMKTLHFTGEMDNVSKLTFNEYDEIDWSFDEGIIGTSKGDKITVSKNGIAFLGGGIDLQDGSNTLSVQKNAEFTSGGAVANIQTISVDACASATFSSTISDLEKMTIASGTFKSGVADKTEVIVLDAVSGSQKKSVSVSVGNYSSLVLAKGLTLSEKSDTITVKNYSLLEINGTLDMDEGSNTLKLGKESSCIIGEGASGIRTLNISSGDKQNTVFTVKGDYTATDESDTLTFNNNNSASISGNVLLLEGSDKVTLGKKSSLVIEGGISSESGTSTITIGEKSGLTVRKDIASGSGKTVISMKKDSNFFAQNLSGISSFTMANPNVSDLEKRDLYEAYNVMLSSLSGTKNADTISVGNGSVFSADNAISLGEGNDKITVGQCARISALTMDLGEGKNSVILNKSGLINVGTSMIGVNKLDVKAGKQVMDEGKDTRSLWSEVFIGKNLELTSGNDTITTDKYSNLNVAGLIKFEGGSDTIKIGSNAEAVLKADDISSLKKMTIGKESKVWLSSELAKFVNEAYSKEDLKNQNIEVYDIGSAKNGIAQNFVSYTYETEDDKLKGARELAKGEELAGWIDNEIDEIDFYKWDDFTSAEWSNNADLLFTQYNGSTELGTSSGSIIEKMENATNFSISFADEKKSGAVIYSIALK